MLSLKFKNKSSREIPAELMASVDSDITYEEINKILEEYNLRVNEYEKVFDHDNNEVEQIFVIGDIK